MPNKATKALKKAMKAMKAPKVKKAMKAMKAIKGKKGKWGFWYEDSKGDLVFDENEEGSWHENPKPPRRSERRY